MKLRTTLLLQFGGLLIGTLVCSYLFVALLGYRAMRDQLLQKAEATAAILKAIGEQALRVQEGTEDLLGGQMIAEAYLTAHLVDIAENHAHLPPSFINDRLRDIADHTVLDEFWITDAKGQAYLRNMEGIDFTFPGKPTEKDQAWVFWQLLSQDHGQVSQRSMPREYDGKVFKYAAVSGIDRSRIVQVGHNADSLRRLAEGMTVDNLARSLAGKGGITRIRAIGDGEQIRLDTDLPGPPEPGQRIQDPPLVTMVRHSRQTGETVTQLSGSRFTVVSPGLAPDGAFFALVTTFDFAPIVVRTRQALWLLAVCTMAAGLIGLGLVRRHSIGIARPLEALTAEAAEIGRGNLDRTVDVKASGEVGVLARAFRQMTTSLKSHIEELKQLTAAKERLEAEMHVAARVQQWMLPRHVLLASGVEMHAVTMPAREVGGDFYDFVPHRQECTAIVIGDASGKGLPAALYAAQSLSVIRTLSLMSRSPSEALSDANSVLSVSGDVSDMFATVFYGMYDPHGHTLRYVNAGHYAPILIRGDEKPVPLVSANSLPLGILQEYEASEQQVQLQGGDVLVMYSDGVIDAQNPDGSRFGDERLMECLSQCRGLGPKEVVACVLEAAQRFADGAEQADDMTVAALHLTV